MPRLTLAPPAATVPLRALETYRSALAPWSFAVMSHGPLISLFAIVSRARPRLSSTSRQPGFAVAAVPSDVGRLPTTTQPEDNTDSAVVSPIPPGQRPGTRAGLIPLGCRGPSFRLD